MINNTNIEMESFSPLYNSIMGETTYLNEFLNTLSMVPLDLAFSYESMICLATEALDLLKF